MISPLSLSKPDAVYARRDGIVMRRSSSASAGAEHLQSSAVDDHVQRPLRQRLEKARQKVSISVPCGSASCDRERRNEQDPSRSNIDFTVWRSRMAKTQPSLRTVSMARSEYRAMVLSGLPPSPKRQATASSQASLIFRPNLSPGISDFRYPVTVFRIVSAGIGHPGGRDPLLSLISIHAPKPV